MPAIWRSVDRVRAASFLAITAVGLIAPIANADNDRSSGPPGFLMTWDASGDNLDPYQYEPSEYGSMEFGTWTLPGGTGWDPGAASHTRTGWRYQGELNNTAWHMSWDCVANADPFVDATINVTNSSNSTQTFWIYMPLLIAPPIPGGTVMAGSVSAAVSDQNFDGATLAATTLEPIFQGSIDTIPQANATIWNPGYSLSAPSFGAASDSSSFNSASGPAALTEIAVKLKFTLSAGDSASVTGTFDVQAVPGPAGLAAFAMFGAFGRRRRR